MKTHLIRASQENLVVAQKAWHFITKLAKSINSHKEISYENYASKSMNSHKEVSQRPKKHENPVRKSHTKNVQHKAWSSITVKQEKEAEFIHRQRKKRRRKNPYQNTVAGKEGKLKLHAQPTTRAPPPNIFPKKPPNSISTMLKQMCLGKRQKGMNSH